MSKTRVVVHPKKLPIKSRVGSKVECKECGLEFFTLASHLYFKHNMTGREYIKKWNLISGDLASEDVKGKYREITLEKVRRNEISPKELSKKFWAVAKNRKRFSRIVSEVRKRRWESPENRASVKRFFEGKKRHEEKRRKIIRQLVKKCLFCGREYSPLLDSLRNKYQTENFRRKKFCSYDCWVKASRLINNGIKVKRISPK